jgi:hypothetical protein
MNKLTLHHLVAEEITDEQGPAIVLTQSEDGFNEPDTVLVHPLATFGPSCEQFGIIASDPEAARTIAVLQRRMLGLLDRINSLADVMTEDSDHTKAQLLALRDLANEWCADSRELLHEAATPQQGELPV